MKIVLFLSLSLFLCSHKNLELKGLDPTQKCKNALKIQCNQEGAVALRNCLQLKVSILKSCKNGEIARGYEQKKNMLLDKFNQEKMLIINNMRNKIEKEASKKWDSAFSEHMIANYDVSRISELLSLYKHFIFRDSMLKFQKAYIPYKAEFIEINKDLEDLDSFGQGFFEDDDTYKKRLTDHKEQLSKRIDDASETIRRITGFLHYYKKHLLTELRPQIEKYPNIIEEAFNFSKEYENYADNLVHQVATKQKALDIWYKNKLNSTKSGNDRKIDDHEFKNSISEYFKFKGSESYDLKGLKENYQRVLNISKMSQYCKFDTHNTMVENICKYCRKMGFQYQDELNWIAQKLKDMIKDKELQLTNLNLYERLDDFIDHNEIEKVFFYLEKVNLNNEI